MEHWSRDRYSNDFESDKRETAVGLPVRVADGTGAVSVSEQFAQRRLLRRRDALLGQESVYNRTVNGVGGKKAYTYCDGQVGVRPTVVDREGPSDAGATGTRRARPARTNRAPAWRRRLQLGRRVRPALAAHYLVGEPLQTARR